MLHIISLMTGKCFIGSIFVINEFWKCVLRTVLNNYRSFAVLSHLTMARFIAKTISFDPA